MTWLTLYLGLGQPWARCEDNLSVIFQTFRTLPRLHSHLSLRNHLLECHHFPNEVTYGKTLDLSQLMLMILDIVPRCFPWSPPSPLEALVLFLLEELIHFLLEETKLGVHVCPRGYWFPSSSKKLILFFLEEVKMSGSLSLMWPFLCPTHSINLDRCFTTANLFVRHPFALRTMCFTLVSLYSSTQTFRTKFIKASTE